METNEPTGVPTQKLRAFVSRIENLEAQKALIADDIKAVKLAAKIEGLDVKTINHIVKLRRQTQEQIDAEQALLDIYKAALGMLGDTPLGGAALKKLQKPKKPDQPPPSGEPESILPPEPDKAETPKLPEATLDEARAQGGDAAASGGAVTDNPWPAGDARRAAWDEGWCMQSGSDGMEIPEAWRRPKKEKKSGNGAPDGEGGQPE